MRQKIDSLYLGTTSADYGKKVSEMKRVPTISVHIRGGDHMKLRESFGILSVQYYISAIYIRTVT